MTRYKSTLDTPDRDFKTLQSQISEAQRFADCERFHVRCRACGTETLFDGITENKVRFLP